MRTRSNFPRIRREPPHIPTTIISRRSELLVMIRVETRTRRGIECILEIVDVAIGYRFRPIGVPDLVKGCGCRFSKKKLSNKKTKE